MNKQTKALASSAILSALGVVILFIGSIIQVLDLSMAVIASIIIIYAMIELRGAWPYLIFSVTALLSLLLLPDKFTATIYLAFAGYYPIIKFHLEKKLPRIIEWSAKLAVFNMALTAILLVSVYVLQLPSDEIGFGWLIYLLGNATFVIYDLALTNLISFYFFKLRKRLGLKRKK